MRQVSTLFLKVAVIALRLPVLSLYIYSSFPSFSRPQPRMLARVKRSGLSSLVS